MNATRMKWRDCRTLLSQSAPAIAAILAALVLSLNPIPTLGQSVEWSVGPLLLLDTDFSDGTEVGPGLSATVTVAPHRTISYFGLVSVARTDFRVASDELHRNFGSAALGLRLSKQSEGPRVGLTLGLGLVAWDDVSETDPAFRSSANAEEMLLPGAELSIPFGSSWRLTLSARDQVTGWWFALLDPEEYGVSHRIVFSLELGSR